MKWEGLPLRREVVQLVGEAARRPVWPWEQMEWWGGEAGEGGEGGEGRKGGEGGQESEEEVGAESTEMSGIFSEGNRAPWRVLASLLEVDPDFSMNRQWARKVWGLGSRENIWEAPTIVQVVNVTEDWVERS